MLNYDKIIEKKDLGNLSCTFIETKVVFYMYSSLPILDDWELVPNVDNESLFLELFYSS
jgi:hypothetical protein